MSYEALLVLVLVAAAPLASLMRRRLENAIEPREALPPPVVERATPAPLATLVPSGRRSLPHVSSPSHPVPERARLIRLGKATELRRAVRLMAILEPPRGARPLPARALPTQPITVKPSGD
jgi:hypothetical protein